jgi:Ca2+:H+ antiporter
MPQEQIDEETEPAFLHQMFESNSSFSSSHDTSSSDGESRSAKNKHGNRIKRAFTHKKSLKSSGKSQGKQGNKKPHLVDAEASALISIKIDEPVLVAEAGEITQSTNRLATMDTVVRGDKIGVKGAAAPLTSSSPRVRDLDRSADTASIVDLEDTDTADARLQDFKSPSRRSRKSRKEESRKRKKRERRTPRDEEVAMAHQVGFINVGREQPQISNRPPPRTRGSLLRPNLPKLFSENIFVKPVRPSELQRYPSRLQRYPSNIPTTPLQRGKSMIHRAPSQRSQYLSLMARRTNSSPKLTAGNSKQEPLPTPTVPGRSMQPSVEPPPFKEPHDENKDSDEDDAEEIDDLHNPDMSHFAAVVLLLASTGLVALCAEFLVGAITEMTKNSAVSQAFIGLIILPIVGNAAEHVTAVVVASKNKMDLAIGVALGSSIQIGKCLGCLAQ